MFEAITEPTCGDADELHREAYNAAFYELGLNWYWDADTYRSLLARSADERDRVRVYLEMLQPHMLKAYDANFLIAAIEEAKARCHERISVHGLSAAQRTNWAEIQRAQVGV